MISTKHPQSLAAFIQDMGNDDLRDIMTYSDMMATREENFRRELLKQKTLYMNSISESLNNLARSISEQKPPVVINLVVSQSTDMEKIKDIVNLIK